MAAALVANAFQVITLVVWLALTGRNLVPTPHAFKPVLLMFFYDKSSMPSRLSNILLDHWRDQNS